METNFEIRQELTTLSHFLGDPKRDLAILGEGNTSGRVDDNKFLVKASGQNLETIATSGFCEVSFSKILPYFEEDSIPDNEVKRILFESKADRNSPTTPSVETFFHAYLLTLPNVNYIGHTHPVSINSILCSRNPSEAISGRTFPDEVVCCGVAPCFVEYSDPGIVLSKLIRKRVLEFFDYWGEYPKTIYLQNHGFIALGKSPADVQSVTMMSDKAARILLGTMSFGGPNFMTQESVDRIHNRPDERYRQAMINRAKQQE